ncbi:MAG TPA: penicillin-binding protein activator [Kofleriaceae bacterium]|nr:penicillin-binding protein activator [Kofleriaceae bacterium]
MKHLLITLALVVCVTGCPRQTRKTLTPDVPQHGDAHARSRFLEARSRFLRDGGQVQDFKAIVTEYPADPIVPWAQLYAGIAAIKSRDFAEADKDLDQVIATNADPGLTARASLFLGITKNYEGDAVAARKYLAGADRAIENDEERTEFLAAVAYSTAAGDKPLQALPVFDQLYPRVTPTEKALIVARTEELVASLDRSTLERLFDELPDRRGPAIAAVGSRLVVIYEASGDTARADKMRENMVPPRAAVGLPKTITVAEVGAATGAGGDPTIVGAVVPLGSKEENRIAEAAVAGLGLAAGAPDGKGVAAIETRAAVDKTSSAEAVDALARQNAIAIIGPIKGPSVDTAAGRAESLGIPLISLATNAELRTSGKFTFHIRHSPDARARTLAQRALAAGIKTFAVFAPDSDYGKGTSKAFTDEVTKGGGRIVTTVTYPTDTKSFADKTGKLKDGWDAVFVADDAQKLALIVPALAASGSVPKAVPFPKKKLVSGRPVLLLSLAEGLDAQFVADAGRHATGAFFAPGFYPDSADPMAKPFIDRFVAAYGRQPGATEAYAFDAAQLAAAAGSGGRAGLAASLAKSQLAGVTGAIKFDADHRRADPGVVYTVVEETGGVFAIRAIK